MALTYLGWRSAETRNSTCVPRVIAVLIPNCPVPFRITSTAQELLDLRGLPC